MGKRELSKNIQEVFADFRGEDWVLYVIFCKKQALPRDIIAECKKFKSEDTSRTISVKRAWYFDRLKSLENHRLIKPMLLQSNPDHSRRYNGYEITLKGKKYIQQKLKLELIDNIKEYNQIAQQELDDFTELIKYILSEITIEGANFYDLFDDILILLSKIDRDYIGESFLNSLDTDYDRNYLLCAVCTFLIIHSNEYIENFIPDHDFEQNLNLSLHYFCEKCEIKESLANIIIEEILTESKAFQIQIQEKAKDQTWQQKIGENQIFSTEKPIIHIPVFFFPSSPSWAFCEKIIQNQINHYFLKLSFKEELFQKDRWIDEIFQLIVKSNLLSGTYTGLVKKQNNDYPYRMHPISYNNPDQQVQFKSLILSVIKQLLNQRKELKQLGLIEIPILALELMEKIEKSIILEKFPDDVNIKYQMAEEFVQARQYWQALPLLKEIFDETTDHAESEIFWKIMDCYQALNQYDEIPKFFELYWNQSVPTLDEFEFYFRTLIDLGKYKDFEKRIEEYLNNYLKESTQNVLKNEMKKCKQIKFMDWMLQNYDTYRSFPEKHVLERIFKLFIYLRFIQGNYELIVKKCAEIDELKYENLSIYLESLKQLKNLELIKQIFLDSSIRLNESRLENEILASKLQILSGFYSTERTWVEEMCCNMGVSLFRKVLSPANLIREIEKNLTPSIYQFSIILAIGYFKMEVMSLKDGTQYLNSQYISMKDLPISYQIRKQFELISTKIEKSASN